ncbi:hypothetical protein IC582_017812 [Cucumis melo]|uniref:Uncharacterized protein LOC103484437 n=2 Tax=Cucumis melo TaxID=3656 RepID=A0A1S3B049_CUCME|nr:uncharacterized protein LOC103484437 [Cucumis melo]ADN34030.1 hypothetical protein [Cucumis melo subsp. melo]
MVSTLQKRFDSRNKLRLVRSLPTYESSGRQTCVFWNAVLFIHKLKLKLEAIEREYSNLLDMKREYLNSIKQFHSSKEVKVEKNGEEFRVKVRCEKGGDRLVSVLEAFEKMGLNVVEARVSCTECFCMEAIAVAEDHHQLLNLSDITDAINVAIDPKLLAPNQHHNDIPHNDAQLY